MHLFVKGLIAPKFRAGKVRFDVLAGRLLLVLCLVLGVGLAWAGLHSPSVRAAAARQQIHQMSISDLSYTQVGAPWPKQYGNIENQSLGVASGCTGVQRWQVNIGLSSVQQLSYSPVIDASGNIYVPAGDSVYAFDSFGDPLWSFTTGNRVLSTPAIGSNGYLYFGSTDDNVYALNSSGQEVWTYTTSSGIGGSATIGSDGTVYIGNNSGIMYALNGLTGGVNWTYQMDGPTGDCPAYGNGSILYASTSSNDGDITAIDTTTGAKIWERGGGSESISPTVAPDGNIFEGDDNGDFIGWNGFTGVQDYYYNPPYVIYSTQAMGPNGDFYFDADQIVAVDQNENKVWGGGPGTSFTSIGVSVASDGTVYDPQSPLLYALSPVDGHTEWSYLLPSFGNIAGGVAIAGDGSLVFLDTNGNLHCLGTESITRFYAVPSTVGGGGSTVGVIHPAFAADANYTVKLHSNNAAVQVPATASLSLGSSGVSFPITTSAVASPVTATITGTLDADVVTMMVTVDPAAPLENFYASPNAVTGGHATSGVVQLAGNAGSGGMLFFLRSSGADVQVPATVTVPQGSSGVSFPITTSATSSQEQITLTVSLGSEFLQTTVTVNPYPLTNFYVSPTSVTGGQSTYGVVQLGGAAGSGGTVVALQSGSADLGVPSTVTVPQGSTGVSFLVTSTAVSTQELDTITATFGSTSLQAGVTLNPAPLSNFYAAPGTVTGGYGTSGVVQLGGKAASGGDTVSLQSASSDVTVPATVTVSGGGTGVSFSITTAAVSSLESVTLTATLGSSSLQTSVTLNPASISNFHASPSEVVGGHSTNGVVQLGSKAGPSGDLVSLSSGSADAAVPSSVTVAAGGTGVSFAITTSVVSASESVTLTATLGSSSVQASLTIDPNPISNFYLSPTSVKSKHVTFGVVQLAGPAGPSGDVVTLTNSDTTDVSCPATVTVPAGSTGVSFAINTNKVNATVQATITATLGPSSAQAVLTVTP